MSSLRDTRSAPWFVNLAPSVDLGPGTFNKVMKVVVMGILYPIEILGLNDVNELLSRLADILNTIVGDNWWVDRDALRDKLPEN